MKPWRLSTVLGTAAATCIIAACNSDSSGPRASVPPPKAFTANPRLHLMLPRGQVRAGPLRGGAAEVDNGIYYHGGPVILAQKVAAIYWSSRTIYAGGPAPGTTGPGSADGSLIGYFLNNLGGSPYYDINTTYTDGEGVPIENSVTYTEFWAANDNVPLPLEPVTDLQMQNQIIEGFTSGELSYDPNTLYVVFTDTLVTLGGACAFHGNFGWNGNDVKFAGLPHDIDFFNCNALNGSPNDDPAADAEVNTLAHETEETNTDEDLSAWYDNAGNENADKCEWDFGATYTSANGSTANMQIGTKDFLVQQNWINANGGGCRLSP